MPLFDPGKRWTSQELLNALMKQGEVLRPFMWSNFHVLRAADGVASYSVLEQDASEANSIAFAFETGEVWAIDTWLLGAQPTYLLNVEIEKMFTERLPQYAGFLMRLGVQPPYRWIAGLAGVKNRALQFAPPQGHMIVPGWQHYECLSEHIVTSGAYDGKQSPSSALLPFFEEIFNQCGLSRPDYLRQ
jgi:hypothetical protein